MDQTNLDFFEAAASGDFAKLCAQVSKLSLIHICNSIRGISYCWFDAWCRH